MLLVTKDSILEYGKLEEKQRDSLQPQAEMKPVINGLIGQTDRGSKIRQLLQRFNHRLEEHRVLHKVKRRLLKSLWLMFGNEKDDERAQ